VACEVFTAAVVLALYLDPEPERRPGIPCRGTFAEIGANPGGGSASCPSSFGCMRLCSSPVVSPAGVNSVVTVRVRVCVSALAARVPLPWTGPAGRSWRETTFALAALFTAAFRRVVPPAVVDPDTAAAPAARLMLHTLSALRQLRTLLFLHADRPAASASRLVLPLDYLLVARAASAVGLPHVAVLHAELWALDGSGGGSGASAPSGLRAPSFRVDSLPEDARVLLLAHSALDDPDGLHTVQQCGDLALQGLVAQRSGLALETLAVAAAASASGSAAGGLCPSVCARGGGAQCQWPGEHLFAGSPRWATGPAHA
jgi:hypothetical protein